MYHKTIWSEGMFLQPQHLQQHDRYLDYLFRTSFSLFQAYAWGFNEIELDRELLPLGKVGLKRCQGLFQDGTLIDIPNLGSAPYPLQIPPTTTNTMIYLALPLRNLGLPDVTDQSETSQPIRYVTKRVSIQDNTSDNINDTVDVNVGVPKLSLLSVVDSAAYSYIGIAMVDEVIAGQGVRLNENYIPPMLNANNQTVLLGYINELSSLINHRADTLAGHVTRIESGSNSDLADFMLLQLMNRYRPLVNDLAQSVLNHPYKAYLLFAQLVGEITTFTHKNAPRITPYLHDHLAETFADLITTLRQSFLLMVNQNPHPIPIEQLKAGLWMATISDKKMLDTCDFIVAARAHGETEGFRHEFPQIFKISSFEEMGSLVTHALPGIELTLLPAAPRKIPFYPEYTYYLLNQTHPLWKQLKTSSGLAFHLSAPLADFHFEVWAIQRTDHY